MASKKKRVQNILNSIKSENYLPRVVEIKYTKVREDGSTVTRVKVKHTVPFIQLDRPILHAMNQLPHQKNIAIPDPYQLSTRKHPRISKNTSRSNSRKQFRPNIRQALNKEAVALLKNGASVSSLKNSLGKIDKRYLKTVVTN